MFIERYFTPGTREEAGWANFREVSWVMGQCSSMNCHATTRYLYIMGVAYVPVCADHACEMAQIVDEHQRCPNCNLHFTDPPQGPVGHVCTSCRCSGQIEMQFTGAEVAGPEAVKWMMDEISKNFVRKVKPEE